MRLSHRNCISSVQDTIPASYDMFKKARPWEKQHDQCGKFTETNTEPGEMCSLEQLEFSKQWDSTQSGCDSFHGDSWFWGFKPLGVHLGKHWNKNIEIIDEVWNIYFWMGCEGPVKEDWGNQVVVYHCLPLGFPLFSFCLGVHLNSHPEWMGWGRSFVTPMIWNCISWSAKAERRKATCQNSAWKSCTWSRGVRGRGWNDLGSIWCWQVACGLGNFRDVNPSANIWKL